MTISDIIPKANNLPDSEGKHGIKEALHTNSYTQTGNLFIYEHTIEIINEDDTEGWKVGYSKRFVGEANELTFKIYKDAVYEIISACKKDLDDIYLSSDTITFPNDKSLKLDWEYLRAMKY